MKFLLSNKAMIIACLFMSISFYLLSAISSNDKGSNITIIFAIIGTIPLVFVSNILVKDKINKSVKEDNEQTNTESLN